MHKKFVINVNGLLINLTAICFVLDIGTVYTHIPNSFHLSGLVAYLPIFFLLLLVITRRRYNEDNVRRALKTCIFLLLFLLVYAIISGSLLRVTIPKIFLVVSMVLYFVLEESNGDLKLLVAYRNIIFILAVISLFFWSFGCILHIINPNSTVTCYWGGAQILKSYYMLHFEREQTYLFGIWITANRSIFTERAFASFAFSIAFLYELLIEEQKSKIRLVMLGMAMISTFSITGLIIMILTIMLYYIFNGNNKTIITLFKILLVPVVVFVSYYSIKYLLDVKFSMGLSASSRMQSFGNGFKAWLQSPIWGYGYGNGDEILQLFNTGSSNSISMILTRGGLMITLLYAYAIIKGLISGFQRKNINISLFVAIVFVGFTFTAIAFTSEMIYLLLVFAYAFSDNRNKLFVTEEV